MYNSLKETTRKKIGNVGIYSDGIFTLVDQQKKPLDWEGTYEKRNRGYCNIISLFVSIMKQYGMPIKDELTGWGQVKNLDIWFQEKKRTITYINYLGKTVKAEISFDKVFGMINNEYNHWYIMRIDKFGLYNLNGIKLDRLLVMLLVDPLAYMDRVDVSKSSFLMTFKRCMLNKVYGGSLGFWALNDLFDNGTLNGDIVMVIKNVICLL